MLFATRWCLSYLAGPLTRAQIKDLTGPRQEPAREAPSEASVAAAPSAAPVCLKDRPVLPPELREFFTPSTAGRPGESLVYHPFLFAAATLQVVNNQYGVNATQTARHALELRENMTTAPWNQGIAVGTGIETFCAQPSAGAGYLPLPTTPLQPRRLEASLKGYVDFVYRQAHTTLWKSTLFKLTSQPGETERDFRIGLQQSGRERRDFELSRLRQRHAEKLSALQSRLARIDQKTAREQEQVKEQKVQTAITVGATILGALMGRKALSAGSLGRATTATRQASRILREKQDVERAQEERESVEQQMRELEQRIREETDQLARSFDPQTETLQEIVIRPSKADILPESLALLWVAYWHDPSGGCREAWQR